MIKKVLLVVVIILGLIAAVLGVAAYRANDILALYQPALQDKLSEVTGSDVRIDQLSLSVLPKTEISAGKFALSPKTGDGVKIAADGLKIGAKLLPLLQKRLELTTIELRSPKIEVLAQSQSHGAAPAPSTAAKQPTATEGKRSPLNVAINRIVVSDGQLLLPANNDRPALSLSKISLDSTIDLKGDQLKVDSAKCAFELERYGPLSLEINQGLLDARSHRLISLKEGRLVAPAGTIQLSAKQATAPLESAIQLRSERINLDKLLSLLDTFIKAPKGLSITGDLAPNLALTFRDGGLISLAGPVELKAIGLRSANGDSLSGITGKIDLSGDSTNLRTSASEVKLDYNGAPIALTVNAALKGDQALIETLNIKGFGGSLSAPSSISLATPQKISTRPRASGLSIASLASALSKGKAQLLSGTITELNGDLSGISPTDPARTTHGSASIKINDGEITGWNLPGQLLKKLEQLPLLGADLGRKIPPEIRPMLENPNTKITELRASAKIAAGDAQLSDLLLVSNTFSLRGSGTYSAQGELNLNSELLFNREISEKLVAKVSQLKPLVDTEGRLVFPLLLAGKPPALTVAPNITAIAKTLSLGNIGSVVQDAFKNRKKLGSTLGNILGF